MAGRKQETDRDDARGQIYPARSRPRPGDGDEPGGDPGGAEAAGGPGTPAPAAPPLWAAGQRALVESGDVAPSRGRGDDDGAGVIAPRPAPPPPPPARTPETPAADSPGWPSVYPPAPAGRGPEEEAPGAARSRHYGGPDQVHQGRGRHLVNWRACLVLDDEPALIHYGRVFDISDIGANVVLYDNVAFPCAARLVMLVPPDHPEEGPARVEAVGRTILTVLGANSDRFRVGFEFMRFEGDGWKRVRRYLGRALVYF